MSDSIYEGYPESKFRWAIKKKTRINYKPCTVIPQLMSDPANAFFG